MKLVEAYKLTEEQHNLDKNTENRIINEITTAISNSLEKYKFGTPGEYLFNGGILKNDTVRNWFNSTEKEGILNKIVGNYFLAYGGHFGPGNKAMDEYCIKNKYDRPDCDYNKLILKVLKG